MTLLVDTAAVEPERGLSRADFANLKTCPVCGDELIFGFGLAFGGFGAYALCDRAACNFARKELPVSEDPSDQITDSAFSDQDQDDIIGQIAEDDIRQRSQQLHEAQEAWEELAYLANPKIPCPECTGAGSVSGGSLGDICVRCLGTRVLEQPGSQPMAMPKFAELRSAIGAYGDALADRALPMGHLGKRGLLLPAASTVPTLESLQALYTQAATQARQLAAGGTPGIVDPKLLREPKKAKGMAGDGDLGDFEDAELADLEDGGES